MRTPGLRLTVVLVLLAPLALFAPVTVLVIHRGVIREVEREIDQRAVALAQQAAAAVLDDVLTGERLAAERKLGDLRAERPEVAYLFVVDRTGHVVAHTFAHGFPRDLLAVAHPPRPSDRPARLRLGGQRLRHARTPMLGGLAGTMHLGIDGAGAQRTAQAVLLRLSVLGLGMVAVGATLTLLLARKLVRRIEALTRAADAVGAGDLDVSVAVTGADELGRLGASFNVMAASLRGAREERERMFLQLARSEKLVAVGQLAAGVAHEINNPLSGTLHCLDNLRREDRDELRRHEYYDLMTDGVTRAQRVVRSLLEFARQHPPDVRTVDLNALTEKALALTRLQFEGGHVRAVATLDPGLPPVSADPHQLGQVVTNLLLNALEAMPGGGLCEVESARVGDECRLRVRDHGHGIPAEARERIFDPFFTTKPDGRGSGLGLSVSLGVVERHGGRIEVTSEPGQGATFDVYLPTAQTPRETPA